MEDIFYLIYLIIPFLPLLIGLFVYFIIHAIRGKIKKGSKEDTVSQFFFLFSVLFLEVFLLALNKDLGDPLSRRTILFLVSVIGLVIAYYFKVIYTLAVSLIGLTGWWSAQVVIKWAQGKDIFATAVILFTGLLLIAIIFYLLGRAHEKEIKFKSVSMVYSILGLIPVTSALFFLSTKLGLIYLEHIIFSKHIIKASFFSSWGITFSFFFFLTFTIGILIYTLNKNLIFKYEAVAIGFLVILFCIIALALFPTFLSQTMFLQQKGYYDYNELSSTGILWTTFFNILVFLEIVGIIFLGYLKQENWLINLGVFFISILIFVKYFDWFFTFLDKSIFFIGAGILLFVVGWFMEKGRRYLLSTIKREKVSQISQNQ